MDGLQCWLMVTSVLIRVLTRENNVWNVTDGMCKGIHPYMKVHMPAVLTRDAPIPALSTGPVLVKYLDYCSTDTRLHVWK